MTSALADEGYRTLLDLRMEGARDGIAIAAAIRADPATAHLPIILCSADTIYLREHADELRRIGVETLAKPFDLDALYGCVAALIGPGTKG